MWGFVENFDKRSWKLCFNLRRGDPYVQFVSLRFAVPVLRIVGLGDDINSITKNAGCRCGGVFGTADNRTIYIIEIDHSLVKLLGLIQQAFLYKKIDCQTMLIGLV